jgi:hypothetical protein
MNRSTWVLVYCCLLLLVAGAAFAKTPDGKPPSVETVCDNEKGVLFGLCNAYCEAQDCTDPNQHSSNTACEQLIKNWEKHAEGRPFPCETKCPCADMLELFAQIETGQVQVTDCVFLPNPNRIQVEVEGGEFATISDGPPGACSVKDGHEGFVELTPQELLVCRVTLRRAVESRGVTCRVTE